MPRRKTRTILTRVDPTPNPWRAAAATTSSPSHRVQSSQQPRRGGRRSGDTRHRQRRGSRSTSSSRRSRRAPTRPPSCAARPYAGTRAAVHWLCLTDVGSYVLMLHVRAARVSEKALPASFPRGDAPGTRSYLLATDSAGGSPVVLVADAENIRAWEQCKRTKSKMWKAQPQVVIEKEAILGFNDEVKEAGLRFNDEMVKIFGREEGTRRTRTMCGPELLWFGERSGAVLLETHGCCLLWLDLHSKKIVRSFSSERQLSYEVYCPYEVDLLSWVPTFSSAVTI